MLRDEDLAVLGYWEWLEGLERGVAAHHAGMLPAFKEIVEELFQQKLLKVVFATETLALGVNMPARSVVLEKLEKFNGEARVPITPGEYTQLTGRAGRRGIDVEGHSVIQWVDGLDPEAVAALASRRSYPLNSSFKPTYNMAVNLIDQFGRERTRQILELSFAQFQADRAVVDLARTLRKQEESMAGYEEAMTLPPRRLRRVRRPAPAASATLERQTSKGNATHAQRERMQRELGEARKAMRAHPCHGCAEREQHARWAERWWRLKQEHDQLSRQIRTRTGQVAKRFDRVTEVLEQLGYLERDVHGSLVSTLGRAHPQAHLRRARPARGRVPATGACGTASTLPASRRWRPRSSSSRDATIAACDYRLPRGAFPRGVRTHRSTSGASSTTSSATTGCRAATSRRPRCRTAMHAWARGAGLGAVLDDTDLAAGDFVRLTKQVVDLLDQISIVADAELGRHGTRGDRRRAPRRRRVRHRRVTRHPFGARRRLHVRRRLG